MPYANKSDERAYRKKWYQRNKDRVSAQASAYRKAHAVENLANVKAWQKANPDKVKESKRKTRLKYIEKNKAYDAAYKAMHQEQCRKHWRMKHLRDISDPTRLEQRRAQQRKYYERNKERRKSAVSAYVKANREKRKLWARITNYRRRARLAGTGGFHTSSQWLARVDYFGWRCVYCQCVLNPDTVTMDHIIPISQGGTDWASNLAPACGPCNFSKGSKKMGYLARRPRRNHEQPAYPDHYS